MHRNDISSCLTVLKLINNLIKYDLEEKRKYSDKELIEEKFLSFHNGTIKQKLERIIVMYTHIIY